MTLFCNLFMEQPS